MGGAIAGWAMRDNRDFLWLGESMWRACKTIAGWAMRAFIGTYGRLMDAYGRLMDAYGHFWTYRLVPVGVFAAYTASSRCFCCLSLFQ